MGAYVKFKLGITHLAHIWKLDMQPPNQSFYNFRSERVLNPRPTGNMTAALPSELSRHVDIICSITI